MKEIKKIIDKKLPLIDNKESYEVIPFHKMPNFVRTSKNKLKDFII